MAKARRTSSTSAAAPRRTRSRRRSRSSPPIPNVKGILVNIFGGIMRCDIIAEGVIAAVKEVGLKVPLVVRLEGTNVDLGKKIIRESGLNVIAADDLDDAAQKIVNAVRRRRSARQAASMTASNLESPICPFSSTQTPRSSPKASPARTARSTPSRRWPTAPSSSAARRRARAARLHLGLPVFDTVAEAREKTGADATRDLRAAARRRGRDLRGDRRRNAAHRLHHRGHSGARHGAGQARAAGLEVDAWSAPTAPA